MKRLIFPLIIVVLAIQAGSVENKEEILAKLSKERYFPYQDILINGELIFKGVGPDCPYRYEAIKKALAVYNRPIKVLDIGASNGYFSLRIAQDFDALCVMADLSDRLRDICELNTEVNKLIYLKRALSLEDFRMLAQHEHFDVVLALNVVHHMSPWREILDTIFELGDTIIIETPPANDNRTEEEPSIPLIENYLLNKESGEIIAQIARADANNFDAVITTLVGAENALAQKVYTPNAYAKMFCFKGRQKLNVVSFDEQMFSALNGVFPQKNNQVYLNLSCDR